MSRMLLSSSSYASGSPVASGVCGFIVSVQHSLCLVPVWSSMRCCDAGLQLSGLSPYCISSVVWCLAVRFCQVWTSQ